MSITTWNAFSTDSASGTVLPAATRKIRLGIDATDASSRKTSAARSAGSRSTSSITTTSRFSPELKVEATLARSAATWLSSGG